MDAPANQDRTIAANHLAAAVVEMLSASYTHKEINDLVRKTVLDESAQLPSRRVLYNGGYGGFGLSDYFMEYLAKNPATSHYTQEMVCSNREDSLAIQAIADFGREICTRSPFILEDLKTAEKWKLNDLIDSDVAADPASKLALDSDLAARLASFQASFKSRHDQHKSDNTRSNFIDYAETHPETWMLHRAVSSLPLAPGKYFRSEIRAVRFAHQLLRDSPETYRCREKSTGDIDAQVYECVGLAGASGKYSVLRLATVPAMVNYTIDEYDGSESVRF